MFAVGAIFLLSLMCVSHSAPPACEDLLRPSDQVDPPHLEGRWALIAGSLSYLPYMENFKKRDSATINFSTNTSSETSIFVIRSIRSDNKCYSVSYNTSLEGSSFTFNNGNITTTFIHTSCHDCVLMSFDVESGKRQHFYLFSRRRQLEEKELEEFRAQVQCLKMPPPAVMDPTKELCSAETDGESAAKTEEKAEGQKD